MNTRSPKVSEYKSDIKPCAPEICPNGNCPGCKDGNLYCSDIRCSPYCAGCKIDENDNYNSTVFILSIMICLIVLAFIIFMFFTPKMIYYDVRET